MKPPRSTSQNALQELFAKLELNPDYVENIQQLWAGYGDIYAVKASTAPELHRQETHGTKISHVKDRHGKFHFIAKVVSPPADLQGDEGHLRKVFSYGVEQFFYKTIASQLPEDVPVATCFAAIDQPIDKERGCQSMAILLSDLRPRFPIAFEKRTVLDTNQACAATDWLAKFHATFQAAALQSRGNLLLPPLEEAHRRLGTGPPEKGGLWLNGGYTYLATRMKEYAALSQNLKSEWSAAFCTASGGFPTVAEMAADFLKPTGREFETYIHGDVKSENMFSNEDGDEMAFFDFQYTGVGLGVCDLAKLFTCSVPLDMLVSLDATLPLKLPIQRGELLLLERYLKVLKSTSLATISDYELGVFLRHWETALVDWCRFQACWGFWGNTEWLQARVRFILGDRHWLDWLKKNISPARASGLPGKIQVL